MSGPGEWHFLVPIRFQDFSRVRSRGEGGGKWQVAARSRRSAAFESETWQKEVRCRDSVGSYFLGEDEMND